MRTKGRPTQHPTRLAEDAEERAIRRAEARGAFRPVPDQARAIAEAQAMARRTLARKAARINIRLAPADLDLLKARAKAEGLPYQTLIASLLHKWVTPPAAAPVAPVVEKKRRTA